jgi:(4-(4-[2-(gamma-L-glutamylamino)ethyl]phenoxymethyl)furan-2-yl)methanamine synthase
MILGLDIGGANIKVANATGQAALTPFELWRNPSGLTDVLHKVIGSFESPDLLAVTMTGELCDCFETKREGVFAILDSLIKAIGSTRVLVWRNDGRFVDLASARKDPLPIASANWLALATFAGRFSPQGPSLLIDIGSTTTDIIPIMDGVPVPKGRTDAERLESGELLYTGVRRTPICALVMGAAELFATTLDAYLLLDLIAENPTDHGTADGRPATKKHANARIARMIGGDQETTSIELTVRLAQQVTQRQHCLLESAVKQVIGKMLNPPRCVLFSGSGEFLALPLVTGSGMLAKVEFKRLSRLLNPMISNAACAYALAVLASERLNDSYYSGDRC